MQLRVPALHSERGQGLAEYALILALVAVVAVAALFFFGNTIVDILNRIGDALNGAPPAP